MVSNHILEHKNVACSLKPKPGCWMVPLQTISLANEE